MDFLAYLQDYFTGYTVTPEANFKYGGSGTVLLYKKLGGGQNYLDSIVQPVQIIAHTDDINTAYELLATFAQTKSGTMIVEDLEYIRQSYSTPMVLSTFGSSGSNHTSRIMVNGTLIVSTNLSDITKVEIDGFEYFTTIRKLTYATSPDTQPDSLRLGTTNVTGSIITFTVGMENKDNDVCVKARRIRLGSLDIDTEFTITLTFSDNEYEEEYTMKLTSYSVDSSNALSPVTVLTFTR